MFYALENFKVNHVSVDPDIISRPRPRVRSGYYTLQDSCQASTSRDIESLRRIRGG